MRYLVMVKASKASEAGELPSAEMLAKMGAFNETLMRDGSLLDAGGLQPTSKSVRMIYAGDRATVIDGPFTETKELISGFWILQARSKEEIIERLKPCPFESGEQIEIRQLFEPEDLAGNGQ